MKLKRIASIYLSLCLVVVYILSAPIQVQAADDEVAERPVWDDSYSVDETPEFDPSVIGMGANSFSDFDKSSLKPCSDSEDDFLKKHVPFVKDSASSSNADSLNHDDEIDLQVAPVLVDGAAALLLILFSCFGSGYTVSDANDFYSGLESYANDSSFNKSFFFMNDVKDYVWKSFTLNAFIAKSLVDKLKNAKTSNGYNISLSDEEKAMLAYRLSSSRGGYITDINIDEINIKKIDGLNYYYPFGEGYRYGGDIRVLYTPNKVAYASIESGYLRMYFYNALLTSDNKFSNMDYSVSRYKYSSTTRLYEFDSSISSKNNLCLDFESPSSTLPFLIVQRNLEKFSSYYSVKSFLMFDYVYNHKKAISMYDLAKNDSYSSVEDPETWINSDKNLYGQVTGTNKAAGAIVVDGKLNAEAKPGTETKPGTGTETKPGTGTDTGTVTASMAADIAAIKTLVGSLQTSIQEQGTSIASITSELQAIKSAVLALQSNLTVTVDNTKVLTGMEELKAEVVKIKSIVDTIPATIAAQNELIDVIPGEIANTRDAVEEVKAEVAALSDTLLDVLEATKAITGSLTDTKAGIKESVDALPGSIANSMVVAGTKELTNTKDESSFAFTNPLSSRFPFSIPWDIAGCITLLETDPVEPVWKIPFKVENNVVKINEEFVIDLSGEQWQILVKIVRAFILIIFVAALAAVTRILIKG